MKRAFIFISIIIVILGYYIFINKQCEFIARDYRYYTLFEEYMAKDKVFDNTSESYTLDKYNLKYVKNELINEMSTLDKYYLDVNLYNDSIKQNKNTISDYNRYVFNLNKIKSKIKNQKEIISIFENELTKLNDFIYKLEKDLSTIKLYDADISYIKSYIKSIDSKTKKNDLSLSLIQYVAATKVLKLEEEIQKNKEIERLKLIAEMEKEIELENQQNKTYSKYSSNNYESRYSSNNYISDYSRYGYTKSYDLPTSYYSTPSFPVSSSYTNSFYSTNTNPNHVQVDGYYKSNGTYVEPYVRTAPNSTIRDNFSTSPNLNPYTGKIGTVKY